MEGGNRKRERQRKETKDKTEKLTAKCVKTDGRERAFKKRSSGLFLWTICIVILEFLNKRVVVILTRGNEFTAYLVMLDSRYSPQMSTNGRVARFN